MVSSSIYRYFIDQPSIYADKEPSDQHLAMFYFEDALKKLYYDFIQVLEVNLYTFLPPNTPY
jgi:hypothetical protein